MKYENGFLVVGISLLLFVGIGFPSSYAQTDLGLDNSLEVTVLPRYHNPEETVRIEVDDFVNALNDAMISWFVDGILQKQGLGETLFNITTGEVGDISRVLIRVSGDRRVALEKTILIVPSRIHVMWEATTYTPPFYRGKALNTSKSMVRVVALPDMTNTRGSRVSPSSLDYSWKTSRGEDVSQSGIGKNVYTFRSDSIAIPTNITLEVSTQSGSVRSVKNLSFLLERPEIILYENDPLLGVRFERELTNAVFLRSQELRVVAFPYFFDTRFRDATDIDYEWRINNGQPSSSAGAVDGMLTLRNEGGSGRTNISVTATHVLRVFQQASRRFSIEF